MTIKEAEQSIGISKANIRFYEKEGLLDPTRNKANNYREYTDQDVLLLKKIKLLRAIDISLPEIHSLITDPDRLSQVLEKRLQTLEGEKQHLQETEDICRRILNENLNFDALSESIIDEQSLRLKDRIALIMTTDMTTATMSGRRLTDVIGGMLLYSLLLTVLIVNIVYSLAGPDFAQAGSPSPDIYELLSCIYPILAITTALMIVMTAKPAVHFIMFQLLTLAQALAILCWLRMDSFPLYGLTSIESLRFINLFILLACAYILLIWICARFTKKYFKHWGCALILPALFIASAVHIYSPLVDSITKPAVFFTIFALYISLRWHSLNKDVEICNRYYAITSTIQMLNAVVFFFSALGASTSWRRGDKEYK